MLLDPCKLRWGRGLPQVHHLSVQCSRGTHPGRGQVLAACMNTPPQDPLSALLPPTLTATQGQHFSPLSILSAEHPLPRGRKWAPPLTPGCVWPCACNRLSEPQFLYL